MVCKYRDEALFMQEIVKIKIGLVKIFPLTSIKESKSALHYFN